MTVVSGSLDGTVKLWDLKTNKLTKTFQLPSGNPVFLKLNPRDLCLAAGSTDKVLRYWELQDYSLVS
jgi:WD40 repeat protein